jgi:hypothetical protein
MPPEGNLLKPGFGWISEGRKQVLDQELALDLAFVPALFRIEDHGLSSNEEGFDNSLQLIFIY